MAGSVRITRAQQHAQFTSLQLPNIRLDFYEKAAASTMTLGHLKEGPFGVTLEDANRTKETLIFPAAFYWVNR